MPPANFRTGRTQLTVVQIWIFKETKHDAIDDDENDDKDDGNDDNADKHDDNDAQDDKDNEYTE